MSEGQYQAITLTADMIDAALGDHKGTFERLREAELKAADEAYQAAAQELFPTPWFDVRPATPEELPAIFEAWAGTFRKSRAAGCVPNHLFNEVTFAAITQLLTRGMQVRVLTARSHPSVVLAWVAYEPDKRSAQTIVHYLFTKDSMRRRGLAKALMTAIGVGKTFIYTHQTSFSKYFRGGYHNPGVARRKDL